MDSDLIFLPLLIAAIRYSSTESRRMVSAFIRDCSIEKRKAFLIRFLHQYFAYCSVVLLVVGMYISDENQYKGLYTIILYILLPSSFLSIAVTHVVVEEKLKKLKHR